MKAKILLVVLSVFIWGCDDSTSVDDNMLAFNIPPEYDHYSLLKCHSENALDSIEIKKQLIGVWEWKFLWCCGFGTSTGFAPIREQDALKIEFKENGEGILIDSDSKDDFIWNIAHLRDGNYEFEINPLSGLIILCDSIMMSRTSHRDGDDNYFKRLD